MSVYLQEKSNFEKYISYHAAATLLGLKAGSLLMVDAGVFSNYADLMDFYGTLLAPFGLSFFELGVCKYNPDRRCVLIYREDLLQEHLLDARSEEVLEQYAYDISCMKIRDLLTQLADRFKNYCEFPHEIGLFLGYPAEDVDAFIVNKGKDYKVCGYWKVYHNHEEKQQRFALFDALRQCLARVDYKRCSIIDVLTQYETLNQKYKLSK